MRARACTDCAGPSATRRTLANMTYTLERIPDGSLVMGSPGKVVRSLEEEDMRGISQVAEHYVAGSALYRAALAGQC